MLTSTYLQFTHYVKAGGRLREFNFLRRAISNVFMFNVDVADERGNRIIFDMQEKEGSWKIINGQVPEWVPKAENDLRAAIAQHQVS